MGLRELLRNVRSPTRPRRCGNDAEIARSCLAMQPVLEFIQRHERSYTYSVRAPHKSTVQREACYVDRGLTSLAACVFDAAQALSPNFLRAHISYQGVWMGEIEVSRLR